MCEERGEGVSEGVCVWGGGGSCVRDSEYV